MPHSHRDISYPHFDDVAADKAAAALPAVVAPTLPDKPRAPFWLRLVHFVAVFIHRILGL